MELVALYYFNSDGPYLRKVTGTDSSFNSLTGNDREFQSARKYLTEEIIKAIEKRFADFSTTGVVLATRIVELVKWPKTWELLKGFSHV